jgi:hypothetical protein
MRKRPPAEYLMGTDCSPGMTVAIHSSSHSSSFDWGSCAKKRVERVTPSGQVVLEGGDRFNARGIRKEFGGYRYDRLCRWNQEIADYLMAKRLEEAIGRTRWDELSLDQLKAIATLLFKSKETTAALKELRDAVAAAEAAP